MTGRANRPRALVYRAIGLGDLLTGVPALRALRLALPEHELVLAAPAAQQPLVELIDAVDRQIATEELEPVAWEGAPPEVGIDLHGNGPASRRLVEALHPGRTVGFGLDPANPPWDAAEHERVRWCRLIADSFGAPTDPNDVLLPTPQVLSPCPGAVIVHPGAASRARQWPVERFAAVARALARQGHEVVVTGSPGERPLADELAARAGLTERAVLAGATDLGTLAAVVASASLVVCGDTGMAHLASAFGTRSVVLFGPTPPSSWGPPPGPHTVLWHGDPDQPPGDPHADRPDPYLLRITVQEVLSCWGASPPSSALSA